MVSYSDVMDSHPGSFDEAGKALKVIAENAERFADHIRQRGVTKVTADWEDRVGEAAAKQLKDVAERADDIAVLARSASTSLCTLADALTKSRRAIEHYLVFAHGKDLTVTAEGKVVVRDKPFTTMIPSLEIEERNRHRDEVQRLIDDMVQAATQADEICTRALKKLSVNPDSISKEEALNLNKSTTLDALESLRNQLPDGLTPEQQRVWWQSLTPKQQHDLELAVPLELAALPGVPDDVKNRMRRLEQGYDALGTLKWAQDHAYDHTGDLRSDEEKLDNCTNFASTALHDGGGLPYSPGKFGLSTVLDDSAWTRNHAGEQHWDGSGRYGHSYAWSAAQNHKDFFLSNGGKLLSPGEVRPGDLAYYENLAPPEKPEERPVHHTAIVSGVLPDGTVLYTQHSDQGRNYNMQARVRPMENDLGTQKIHFARPKKTW
ncbi:hypothetical protein KEM60_02932 [Austwickia sp. TVS 96-490-7B]|uniref:amidase domain-containing protein n=1 Tax=Austwickia sp. TVS 96-490-7B TaxID=2830843 RepID=UPI001C5684AE|nr:amidase domain-containing protein [Austwickia sp. TVS 96-490-7B]MBW3086703.1 hypothetical protein [Austwickia sp. TVS 96-490-7B]